MTTPIIGLTTGIEAKRNLIRRLKNEADGGLLRDVSVDYAYNGQVGRRSIYGGGWRGTPKQLSAESGSLYSEVVTAGLYIRIRTEGAADVETLDGEGGEIAAILAAVAVRDPRLAGGMTWLGIAWSQGDYSRTDAETIVVHAYQAQIATFGSWGP